MNDVTLMDDQPDTSTDQTSENKTDGCTQSDTVRKKRLSRKFKHCMKRLLDLPAAETEQRNELIALGLSDEEIDNYMLVAATVFKKAVGGDLKFIQELRHIISDNETDLDRKTGLAQLDKIKAQTEEIRQKFSGVDHDDEQYRQSLIDVLNDSAAVDWSQETE